MKLRACFPRLQLIFLIGCAVASLGQSRAHADVIYFKDGRPPQEVRVVRVNGTSLEVQVGAGTLGLQLAAIAKIEMAEPPEWELAKREFAAKKYADATIRARGLIEKFKGLPMDWVAQAMGMLADTYLATGQYGRADVAYKEFRRLYPAAAAMQADVGEALVLVGLKKFEEAKPKLEVIAVNALKDRNATVANGLIYSKIFLALGRIKENSGNLSGALEDYLRTVIIFSQDSSSVAAAQELADALIARKISVP